MVLLLLEKVAVYLTITASYELHSLKCLAQKRNTWLHAKCASSYKQRAKKIADKKCQYFPLKRVVN